LQANQDGLARASRSPSDWRTCILFASCQQGVMVTPSTEVVGKHVLQQGTSGTAPACFAHVSPRFRGWILIA